MFLEESVSWAFQDGPSWCLVCWADSRDLEERERRKPDLPDPEWGEGHWLGSIFPPSLLVLPAQNWPAQEKRGREGVPGKAEPEAVDGLETSKGVAVLGRPQERDEYSLGRGHSITGWGSEGGTWGSGSQIPGQRMTKGSPLLLLPPPLH